MVTSIVETMTIDTIGGTNFMGAVNGYIYVTAIVASQSGTLNSIGIQASRDGGTVRVGIYSHKGGGVSWNTMGWVYWDAFASFSELLCQSDSVPIIAGWNDINVFSANVTITAGSTYYIAFETDRTAEESIYYKNSDIEVDYEKPYDQTTDLAHFKEFGMNLTEFTVLWKYGSFPDLIDSAYGLPHIHNLRITYSAPSVVVLWNDATVPAVNWEPDDSEVLSDDDVDKPDGTHPSMDITIGSGQYFDDFCDVWLESPEDASHNDYISLWWKGVNNGHQICIKLYNSNWSFAQIGWIDDSANWQHLHFKRSDFTLIGDPFDWSAIIGIEILLCDAPSDIPEGTVLKIAYITNDNGS
jgi:hypothetical protein